MDSTRFYQQCSNPLCLERELSPTLTVGPQYDNTAYFAYLCPRFSLILPKTCNAAVVMRVPGPKMAQAPAL
jgi:hypothetical protein